MSPLALLSTARRSWHGDGHAGCLSFQRDPAAASEMAAGLAGSLHRPVNPRSDVKDHSASACRPPATWCAALFVLAAERYVKECVLSDRKPDKDGAR
jgi:hypothetical protein